MSQVSGKKDSIKGKIEKTSYGVKVMGLNAQSSAQSKKDSGRKNSRTPARKCYKSSMRSQGTRDSPVFEDVSHEISSADEEADVEASAPQTEVLVSNVPDKENSPSMDSSSESKNSAPENEAHEEVSSEESTKSPPSVHEISDADDSDDVPLASVAARMKKRRRVPVEDTPSDVPSFPIDNVSFHAAENVLKWKYVCNRRIAKEREIGKDVLECKFIVALIDRAGLRKTIMNIGKCYEKLVKEFLVNLTEDVGIPGSAVFRKVYVRRKCVNFSPAVINQALGRSVVELVEEELSLDKVAKELTAGQVKKWPAKKLLSTGLLSVKYAILNRIGVVNWIPSHHTSAVSASLAKLIYRIGTEVTFDFGSLVFAQTLKQAETCAIKLPITLDHRLFLDPHVLDIDMPSRRTSIPVSMSASGTQSVIAELEDLSKELQVSIKVATERKLKVDTLITKLKEEAGHEGESRSDATEEEGSEEEESSSEA
ncbi:uncharacterized protein LOC130735893 [Lotus japonicus]|uniref:uncharacterized protein LOC130735893 n=1 Tax=Lotus japonicus TaxID=34305 RepID=UPI00258BA060|nr:uncharacterized protein LOC130735893 [Lotus japonicus]